MSIKNNPSSNSYGYNNDFSNFGTYVILQLPVQVKKNPGLGFSIAGGVAGAETVRVTDVIYTLNFIHVLRDM